MVNDIKTRWPWRALFSGRSKSGVADERPTWRNRETGYRDPFVELPGEHLAAPATSKVSWYEALASARNALNKTQTSDSVEDLTTSIERLRDGIARVHAALPDVYQSSERISELGSVVYQLQWLLERRIEQVATLRSCVRKHCPSALAAAILRDSMRLPGEPRITAFAPRCSADEHVHQLGEPRCDCGRVAVRTAPVVEEGSGSAPATPADPRG
jgi:hypothetical protein